MQITKQEAVQQILGIMQDNNITVADINAMIKAQSRPQINESFDLLCEVNGTRKRLPFDTGKDLNPIAIFPRQNLKFFLSLEETGMIPFPPVKDKDQLLDEDLCTLLMDVRPELNEKLRELGKPILSGDYWLNGHEFSGVGYWIANIREDRLRVDYYDARSVAKVRHIGHL